MGQIETKLSADNSPPVKKHIHKVFANEIRNDETRTRNMDKDFANDPQSTIRPRRPFPIVLFNLPHELKSQLDEVKEELSQG